MQPPLCSWLKVELEQKSQPKHGTELTSLPKKGLEAKVMAQ